MKWKIAICALFTGIVTLAYAPQEAAACSIACPPGATTPGDMATVPANDKTIYWRTFSPMNIKKGDIQLSYQASPGGPSKLVPFNVQVPAQPNMLLIEPTNGLKPNVTYHLKGSNCSTKGIDLNFDTTGTKPLPSSLGQLRLVNMKKGQITIEHGASCSTRISAAQARVRVELSNKAKAWKDVIRYQTFVDGKPWNPREVVAQQPAPGASWKGRGEDVLYAACNPGPSKPSPNLSLGTHTVHMKAYITATNGTKTFTTNKLRVGLRCFSLADDIEHPDAGPDAGADTGPEKDTASAMDSGTEPDTTPAPDARATPDTSTSTQMDTGSKADVTTGADTAADSGGIVGESSGKGDGCSCTSRVGPRPGSLALVALLALALGVLRRRR